MIIGLCGLKRSGKDTVAAYLMKEHGFERKAFADPLKKSIAALFDIPFSEVDKLKNDPHNKILLQQKVPTGSGTSLTHTEREITFREFLQRYGTEGHRDIFGHDFWIDLTLPVRGFYPGRKIVVTDVRFANEAERIKSLGGYIWMVYKPSPIDLSCTDQHSSEQLDFEWDYTIDNMSTISKLHEMTEFALNSTVDKESVSARNK